MIVFTSRRLKHYGYEQERAFQQIGLSLRNLPESKSEVQGVMELFAHSQ